MAAISPLQTLRYDPSAVGSLEAVIAPPYDVIDDELRAQLLAQSPFNVVEIDLPKAPGAAGAIRTSTPRRPSRNGAASR